MSKHSRVANSLTCQHLMAHEDCPWCALQRIWQATPKLEELVGAGQSRSLSETGGRRGGTPSWEPIDVGALSLLQDLDRAGLARLERDLDDEQRHPAAARVLHKLDDRCKRILGEAFAPHTPLVPGGDSSRGKPVGCPMRECRGILQVHREDDPRSDRYGKPNHIQCSHDRRHRWNGRDGGYLRLKVDLAETATAKAAGQ